MAVFCQGCSEIHQGHGVYRCITDPGSGSVSGIGISPRSEGSGVPPPRGSPRGGGTPDPGGEGRIGFETVRRTRDPGSRDKPRSDRWTPCLEGKEIRNSRRRAQYYWAVSNGRTTALPQRCAGVVHRAARLPGKPPPRKSHASSGPVRDLKAHTRTSFSVRDLSGAEACSIPISRGFGDGRSGTRTRDLSVLTGNEKCHAPICPSDERMIFSERG